MPGSHLVTRDWMLTGLLPHHTVPDLGRAGIPAAEGGQVSQSPPHGPGHGHPHSTQFCGRCCAIPAAEGGEWGGQGTPALQKLGQLGLG